MANLYVFTIAIFTFVVLSVNGQGLGAVGGLGAANPATDDVNQLITRLKPQIIKRLCDYRKENCPSSDANINVNSYKTQVVAGTNYFISATIGDDTYHIKIFTQSWTNTEEVHNVQGPKQHTDEISYF